MIRSSQRKGYETITHRDLILVWQPLDSGERYYDEF